MIIANDYNQNTPEGHAYHQSEARKEDGCSACPVSDDPLQRVKDYLARRIRFEHAFPTREWTQWYYAAKDFLNERTK